MTRGGVPGASVAVGVHGQIVWSEGFGYAIVEHRVPVTTITKFRTGSILKTVTGAASMLLWEQGLLDLDAPVQRYVASFPDKGHKITPRHLATHTSGLRHFPPDGDEFFNIKPYKSALDPLEIFQNDPLLFEPGTKYSYSSYGTLLLGATIERAGGKPYLTVLRELIFEPLGMRATMASFADSIIPNVTSFYQRTDQRPNYHTKKTTWGDGKTLGTLIVGPFTDNSNKWASGGFVSTPEDFVRFGSAHLKPGFLKAKTLEAIFSLQPVPAPQETPSRLKTGRGMNWQLGVDGQGRRTYSHGGGAVGGTSSFVVFPAEGVVVVVMCNLTDARYEGLAEKIGQLFIEAAPRTAAAP